LANSIDDFSGRCEEVAGILSTDTDMNTVAVIDYGMGNLRSVSKALEHVSPRWWYASHRGFGFVRFISRVLEYISPRTRVKLTSNPEEIRRADRVVFPGQGAIGGCIAALESHGLRAALLEATQTKPFLGICLGLQALFEFSEEDGGVKGLGLLPGRVPLFPREKMRDTAGRPLKVPHMGWNQVHQVSPHPLWRGIPQDARFYFVHSYYADPGVPAHTMATTDYGIKFASACARQNMFAVQFHPEKSQQAGLNLLANFIRWDGTDK